MSIGVAIDYIGKGVEDHTLIIHEKPSRGYWVQVIGPHGGDIVPYQEGFGGILDKVWVYKALTRDPVFRRVLTNLGVDLQKYAHSGYCYSDTPLDMVL